MPYPTTYRGHPLLSRYGRSFWRGWHAFLGTGTFRPLSLRSQGKPYRHAYWAGYDMAHAAMLCGHFNREEPQ